MINILMYKHRDKSFLPFLVCLLCLIVQPGWTQIMAQSQTSGIIRLIPGVPVNQRLQVSEEGENLQRFRVTIPEDVFAVRFELSNAPADLDLLLYQGDRTLVAAAEFETFDETIVLSHTSNPPIQTGAFLLEVAYQWNRLPRWAGQVQREIPYTLVMHLLRPQPGPPLQPGRGPIQGTLGPENGMMKAFEVEVPRGARELRFDLIGKQADVDLYVFIGGIGANPQRAAYAAASPGSNEWLLVNPVEDATARYGIMVLGLADEVSSDFELWISQGIQPPPQIMTIPSIPNPQGMLDRASAATIELLDDYGGGSGVLISSDGWILSNYHVIQTSHSIGAPVRVNFDIESGFPPRELFLAKIVEVYPQGDLALLKIESGFYSQALSPDIRFPYFELGDPGDLHLGSELGFFGYPNIGALGSRSTLTYTRGIVSGFEFRGVNRLIKSDGIISSGSSGGAVINSRGKLVALSTQISYNREGSSISFHYPLTMVPRDWWSIVGVQPGFLE